MANRERGEFTLVAGAQRYVLRLTTNACCELEEFSGRVWDQILMGAHRGSVKDVRFILWAALREHHSDIAAVGPDSLKAVGRLIDASGGLTGIHAQIKALIALNADSGETDTGGVAKAETRPLDAQVGTGGSSMLTPLVAA